MIDIIAALTRANTNDAAFRKLVLLLNFFSAGRSGEVAGVAWPLISMNYALRLPVVNWYDLKNSKTKPVVLVPDKSCPESDIYLAFSDAAAVGQFNRGAGSAYTDVKFLFAQFADVGNKSTAAKVSRMLQDMVPGAPGPYAAFSVPVLNEPGGYTSQGIRHGAIEEMEANGVGPSFVTDLSGHAPGSKGGAAQGNAFSIFYHKATPQRVTVGKSPPQPHPTHRPKNGLPFFPPSTHAPQPSVSATTLHHRPPSHQPYKQAQHAWGGREEGRDGTGG